MKYESERVSYFYNGLITILNYNKNQTKTITTIEPIYDEDGRPKVDNKTGELVTKKITTNKTEIVPTRYIDADNAYYK